MKLSKQETELINIYRELNDKGKKQLTEIINIYKSVSEKGQFKIWDYSTLLFDTGKYMEGGIIDSTGFINIYKEYRKENDKGQYNNNEKGIVIKLFE